MPLLFITVSRPFASAPLLLLLNSQSDLTMGTNWIRKNAHENKDNKNIFNLRERKMIKVDRNRNYE
jgi:hypothetical protein